MRSTVFTVALAILATGLIVLLIFGGTGHVAGLPTGDFASVVYLVIFALLVASSLARGRHRANLRLWHVAVWLAIFVAVMAAYQLFHPGDAPLAPFGADRSQPV